MVEMILTVGILFQDMRIKVSSLVDASGRIQMPYLDTWRWVPKFPKATNL